MAQGRKTGGRKKGTPNKGTEELFAVCAKYKLDVFEALVKITTETKDHEQKFFRLLELAPYLYAKRKSVEVGIDPEQNTFKLIIEDYTKK